MRDEVSEYGSSNNDPHSHPHEPISGPLGLQVAFIPVKDSNDNITRALVSGCLGLIGRSTEFDYQQLAKKSSIT